MKDEEHELSRIGMGLVILAVILAAIVIYVTWVGKFS